MTLDEARKLKPGDKILLINDHIVNFFSININDDIVYESDYGAVCTISHECVSPVQKDQVKEPVYEWLWKYDTNISGCSEISKGYYTLEEANCRFFADQKIENTRRIRM